MWDPFYQVYVMQFVLMKHKFDSYCTYLVFPIYSNDSHFSVLVFPFDIFYIIQHRRKISRGSWHAAVSTLEITQQRLLHTSTFWNYRQLLECKAKSIVTYNVSSEKYILNKTQSGIRHDGPPIEFALPDRKWMLETWKGKNWRKNH